MWAEMPAAASAFEAVDPQLGIRVDLWLHRAQSILARALSCTGVGVALRDSDPWSVPLSVSGLAVTG
jgi:hypothetical protein